MRLFRWQLVLPKLRHSWAVICAIALSVICSSAFAGTIQPLPESVFSVVRDVESRLGARVGVAMVDEVSGRQWGWRSHERFPLNSTFKVFACAALLAHIDVKGGTTTRPVPVTKADIVTYSPVLESKVGSTVTLVQLCEAAVTVSDNAAANLMLEQIDGPAGLTRFMRSLGDEITRLDRYEPALNEAIPGDVRDTTTPAAIVGAVLRLVTGDALGIHAKAQLVRWMKDNQVAGPLLRAVLPAQWHIADRTGAGGHGSRSIVAVVWPTADRPWGVAIYLTQNQADMASRNRAIANIGRAMFDFMKTSHR